MLVCAALAASVMTVMVLASPAQAATYTVTTTDDSGEGSLRQAMLDADASNGADTIEFALPASGPHTITLSSQLPVVTDDAGLTIDGKDITVSGNYAVRVLEVGGGAGLVLKNLTVTEGLADSGGGIRNDGTLEVNNSTFFNNYGYDSGGGIRNSGTATVNSSTFSYNNGDVGAGISNFGSLEVKDSTFSGNEAWNGGGGIFNFGTATVDSSTFFNNSAGGGGGILHWAGTLEVNNSTIYGNSAIYSVGGGISNGVGVTFRNTIVANNTSGGDCAGDMTDGGYNLDSDNTCGFSVANNSLSGVTASELKLGPLQDNGGPTETMALLEGSKAIDQGKAFGVSADQRGLKRPSDFLGIANASGGDGSDIGAFEAQAPNVAPTVAVARGGSCGTDDRSGTITLAVDDPDGTAESLRLSASSSKPALVPNSNVTFGGTGADRTLTATAASGKTGTAVLTVTVTDGQQLDGTPLTVNVRVGVTATTRSSAMPTPTSCSGRTPTTPCVVRQAKT